MTLHTTRMLKTSKIQNILSVFIFIFQRFMRFLFLSFFSIVWAQASNFSNFQLNLSTISQGSMHAANSSIDACRTIRVGNSWLYHLSPEGVYERWSINNLTASASLNNLKIDQDLLSIFDFQIGFSEQFISFSTKANWVGKYQKLIYTQAGVNKDTLFSKKDIFPSSQHDFVKPPFLFEFYRCQFIPSPWKFTAYINKRNSSYDIINMVRAGGCRSNMAVSSNYTYAVIWSKGKNYTFYNLDNLTSIGDYSPPILDFFQPQIISFSRDETLAIIQTDNFNPAVIISLSNLSILHEISVNQTIYQAYFLNSSNQFVVLFCQFTIIVVDLHTDLQYSTTNLFAQSTLKPNSFYNAAAFNQNYLFSCYDNRVKKTMIILSIKSDNQTFTPNRTSENKTIPVSPNQTDNQTFTPNRTSENETIPVSPNKTAQNNKTQYNQAVFYYQITFNEAQKQIVKALNSYLETTIAIADYIANFIAATPISLYFLAYLNFINTCSLYVLLNFPLPRQIYDTFSFLYNSDLFSMLGINPQVPQFTEQKVTFGKALQFGITSDLIKQNYLGFSLSAFNIAVILILNKLSHILIKKPSILKQFLEQNRKVLIYGQIINLMQPLIIPWSFIVFSNVGVTDFLGKVNALAYFILFFICVLFPFFYMLQLVKMGQMKVPERIKQIQTLQTVRIKRILTFHKGKKSQMQITCLQKSINVKAGLKNHSKHSAIEPSWKILIKNKMLSEWFNCQSNFVFPLLVLLQKPAFFLVIIMCHNILGLIISLNSKKHRINKTILASYPVIFHSCFAIFYWCSDRLITANFTIVCLLCFLCGLIHHTLTICLEITINIVKLFRYYCGSNKVAPKQSNMNQASSFKQQEEHEKEETRCKQRIKSNNQEKQKSKGNLQVHFSQGASPIQILRPTKFKTGQKINKKRILGKDKLIPAIHAKGTTS